ncbi:hypothetical protein K437DRAFT_258933 [Tilletiaria anomala UBC 951]|uniref:Cation efflux protein transmembrane domain-containing protein n=1 Tax=Tilletiaria anomala (strain ATCC 24038 / CBS 436.72 / UBC 951) TaxID=1037660 RepID=A0A066VHI8_TILAU|nr:uncharacterized protein K437DRAFT_258933 [Tilletiaria anomala UBC 951]KDN39758.1 hypothetical protein K437DRAFT_258933 [Tilletiaria anomala UBC 951]
MSYANHPARPSTPPGGRSSLDKYTSSANRSYSHLQQLYLDPLHSPLSYGLSKRGSYTGGAAPLRSSISHPFPSHAESLRDVAALEKLLEGEAGKWEHARKDEEELKAIGRMKNGSRLVAYYERQNSILDGWKEVDLVLGSHFPYEVMMRFGTEAEIAEMNASRKARKLQRRSSSADRSTTNRIHRLLHKSDESNSDDSDDGFQEDDGSDQELESPQPGGSRHGFARAASALSGLWFGKGKAPGVQESPECDPLLSSSQSNPSDLEAQRERQLSRLGRGQANTLSNVPEHWSRYGSILEDPSKGVCSDDAASGVPSGQDSNANAHYANGHLVITDEPRLGTMFSKASSSEEGSLDRRFKEETAITRRSENEKLIRDMSDSRSGISDPKVSNGTDDVGRNGSDGHNSASAAASGQPEDANTKKAARGQSRTRATDGNRERDRKRLLASVPGLAEKESEAERSVQFAININLVVNVLLLAGKGIAVLSSNSISLLASLVDSALDLLSTLIIFVTSKAIAYRSVHTMSKYPVGKKRFEPLGVVVFSVLMIASFCQVLVESCQRLWAVIKTGSELPDAATNLPLVGIIFMVATIGIKAVMWQLYRSSRSSGVRAVAQDAENDVVFNIASLVFPVLGAFLKAPALDPIGGIALSIYIISEWVHTLAETVTKLSGSVCGSHEIARALYLILRFKAVRSVSAFEMFHSGDDMIVECDLVLPSTINLKDAHDVAEIMTYCTECLSEVERAYLHLDYNERGPSGHMTLRG